MIRKEYSLFEVLDRGIDLRHLFYNQRLKPFFTRMQYHPEENKAYMVTDKTMTRLENMEFGDLKPCDVLTIARNTKTEKGYILTTGTYNRLHLGYLISPDQILIVVMKGQIQNHMSDWDLQERMVGSIVVNEQNVLLIPAAPLSVLYANESDVTEINGETMIYRLKSGTLEGRKDILYLIKKVIPKMGTEIIGNRLSYEILKNNPEIRRDQRIQGMFNEYDQKYARLMTALKMFLFIKTAPTYLKEIIDESKTVPRLSYNKKIPRMTYTLVDSNWDMEINVSNPFTVRGHFRMQAKKNEEGEWYHDLIYVDAYLKSGYHRRSGKELNEEQ